MSQQKITNLRSEKQEQVKIMSNIN